VGAALADHQALDGVATARAGLAGTAKNFEKRAILAGFALQGIKIGLTVTQGGA